MTSSKSYAQILKSSSLIGGAQLIQLLMGILKTKFVAIYLGPTGVGLIGAYQSIIHLGSQISSLGINRSGVRDVASAAGTGDMQSIMRTIAILRRMCWLTGILGAMILLVLAFPISKITFGTSEHTWVLAFLSAVVFLMAVSQGQMAVIQGLRHIGDLVRVHIIGSVAGVLVSIAVYRQMGMPGIAPSLLIIALFQLGASWWFSRRLYPTTMPLTWYEAFSGARQLFSLGIAFMVSGITTTLTAYAARAFITRLIGLDGLGMYQAAFGISAYVMNFVLGAMGTDFYPRLAGVANDHPEMSRLVNEQMEIGLLLATPMIMIVLSFAPLVIRSLYSVDFYPAVALLRWFALGCFLRVISWPMGYILIAKGNKRWFIFSEVCFNTLNIVFIVAGIMVFGLQGTAMSFFFVYIIHVWGMKWLARHLIGFAWSSDALNLILISVAAVVAVYCGTQFLPGTWSMAVCGLLSVLAGMYCLRQLTARLGENHKLNKMLRKIGLGKRPHPGTP